MQVEESRLQSIRGKLIITGVAVLALVAQPLYGAVAAHVASAATDTIPVNLTVSRGGRSVTNGPINNLSTNIVLNFDAVQGADQYNTRVVHPNGSTEVWNSHNNTWLARDGAPSQGQFGAHGDGDYTYEVRARSAATREWSAYSAPVVLTYDTTAPMIDSITANNRDFATDGSAIVSGKDGIQFGFTISDEYAGHDYTYAEVKRSNGAWVQGTSGVHLRGSNPTWTIPADRVTGEGGYVLKLCPRDRIGNGNCVEYPFTVDNTAPTLQINGSTESGRYFGSGRVGAAASVDDFDRLVIEQRRANGEYTHRHTYTQWGGTANLSWLGDGEYRTQVFDPAGNESGAVTFTIDTTPPTIESITLDRTLTNQNQIIVRGTVTDLNLEDYNIRVYNADRSALVSPWIGYTGTENVEDGTLARLNISSLADGDYWVRVWADDLAGNRSGISSHIYVPFTVDRTAPAAPAVTSGGATTVSGAAEAGSIVTVFIAGEQVGITTANSNGIWSFTFDPALASGTHSVTARATDQAGNTSSSSIVRTILVTPVGSGSGSSGLPFTGSGNSDSDNDDSSNTTSDDNETIAFNNNLITTGNVGGFGLGLLEDSDNTGVLGAQSGDDDGNVAGAASNVAQAADDPRGFTLAGLAWYWWLAIVAGVGLLWWLIAAARRRNSEQA